MINALRPFRSWNVWFGIHFRFHPLFALLLMLSVLTGYFMELATLFGIVLIHELGHVAAARSLGLRVHEVQLLPFGGVAVIEDTAGISASKELVVALAGPLQNGWLAVIGYLLMLMGLIPSFWGEYFIKANLWIALFNLLPILPLDGGKVMQVLFGLWLPYQRTMQVTSWISLGLSALFIIGALLYPLYGQGGIQLNGLLIGCFLFYSNWYEWRGVPYRFMRFLLQREQRLKARIAQGAHAGPIIIGGHLRAGDVVRLFMRDRYHVVYVLDEQASIRHVIPEQAMLNCYFDETKRGRTVFELFA